MIVKEHYDVVVVGAGLAPAACAALLCKRGFRVLVVGGGEPREGPSRSVTAELDSPVARRILTELGIAQVVRRKEQPVDPLFQVVTPWCRIGFPADPDRLAAEFAREMPAERAAAAAFYQELPGDLDSIDVATGSGGVIPPRGFIERQRLKRTLAATRFGWDGRGSRLLEPLESSPRLGACVMAQVVPWSRLERGQIAPAHVALGHGRAIRRMVAIEGGLDEIRRVLLGRVENSRGESKPEDRVEWIEVQRGRAVWVKLVGHESAVGCDQVVCGVEATSFERLLREDGRPPAGGLLHAGDLEVAGHIATLVLVVRGEIFPDPMARLVYALLDGDAPRPGPGLVVLETGPGPAAGTAYLLASFHVAHGRVVEDRGYLAGDAQEVRRKLDTVIPFLEEFVEEERPIAAIREIEEAAASGEEHPSAAARRCLPPVYRAHDPGPLGACGLHYETRLRNVFLCSHEVLPGLGPEGAWNAAWGAARLLADRDPGKSRWRSRRGLGL